MIRPTTDFALSIPPSAAWYRLSRSGRRIDSPAPPSILSPTPPDPSPALPAAS